MSLPKRWPWLFPFSGTLAGTLDYAATADFKSGMKLQLAAAALAVRLYQVDHHGRRPDRLTQLVPRYLNTVPKDLFAKKPQPIGYKPRGVRPILLRRWQPSAGPSATQAARSSWTPLSILYSVGEDHQDDGGLVLVDQQGELVDVYDYKTDQYFLLEPKPKATPRAPGASGTPGASTQPATQPATQGSSVSLPPGRQRPR